MLKKYWVVFKYLRQIFAYVFSLLLRCFQLLCCMIFCKWYVGHFLFWWVSLNSSSLLKLLAVSIFCLCLYECVYSLVKCSRISLTNFSKFSSVFVVDWMQVCNYWQGEVCLAVFQKLKKVLIFEGKMSWFCSLMG